MEENQAQQQQPTTQEPTEDTDEVSKVKEKSSIGNWVILILAFVIVVALVYIV